ncbi:MAG: formate dehydrogenase subunit alpha [Actinobacteria bacterium]|nr:MAG: formate dehydrogenase subunit alpha [Actinomycetota bacterium]
MIKKDGKFAKVSWDEATDYIAKRLKEIKEKNTADSIGVLASAKITNEENYIIQKFARATIGTNNVDHCARLCHSSTVSGLAQSFGTAAMTNSISDIDDADCILVIGSNTTEAHPVIGFKIRQAARTGRANLIVIDPRKIKLAEVANHWLSQKPGTDVAAVNGLIHVLIKEGLVDEQFIKERTEGYEELKKAVEDMTPAKVEEITGIPADDLVAAAKAFGKAKNASVFYSMGITQHSHGTDNVLSLANLVMITGNIGRPGAGLNPLRGQNNVQGACDMGCLNTVYPGYQQVSDDNVKKKFEAAWDTELSPNPGLTVTELTDGVLEGKIKAMYIVGENPMVSDPDIGHVKKAFSKLDFLVVQDIFLTETAQLADVVLPSASFAEKEGTFTNTERRVQLSKPAIKPIGKSRPDWQIISEVSTKMGYPMNYNSAEEIFEEVRQLTPIYCGITHERLKKGSLQFPCLDTDHPGTPVLHVGKFPRGKGLIKPTQYIASKELPDEQYPLILSTGRTLPHFHTGTMTRKVDGLNELSPGGYAEINPEDASKLKIIDGQRIKLVTRRGEITTMAKVVSYCPAGAIFVPFHFAEAAANKLTNTALDPVSKIPEYKVCAVRVEKV